MKLYNPTKHSDWRYVGVKRDGFRVRIALEHQWNLRVYTRKGIDIAPSLYSYASQLWVEGIGRWPTGYDGELMGELFVPGHPSSEVPSAIAQSDVHRMRFELFHADCNKAAHGGWGWDFTPLNVCNDHGQLLESFEPTTDIEGYIFQEQVWADFDSMVKWKPVFTADCKVVDIKPGVGKYIGCIGALICKGVTNDGHEFRVNVSSGLVDEDRYLPDEHWLGRMIEIRYQYIAAGGRPRHPVFVRVREDL